MKGWITRCKSGEVFLHFWFKPIKKVRKGVWEPRNKWSIHQEVFVGNTKAYLDYEHICPKWEDDEAKEVEVSIVPTKNNAILLNENNLLLNGFEKENENRFHLNIGGHFGVDIWINTQEHTLCINEFNKSEETFDRLMWLRHIQFVHELKNAFKLCGLTELESNFKI